MWTEVCGRKFVDGSLLTEVVDESCPPRELWTEVVDRRRKLWIVDGKDFRSSLLGRDRPYGAQNEK